MTRIYFVTSFRGFKIKVKIKIKVKRVDRYFFSRSHALRGNACLDALRRFFNLIYGIFFATGRGASKQAFPRRAWEREKRLLRINAISCRLT